MATKLNTSYDAATDILTVDGMKYSGDFFRAMGSGLHLHQLFYVTSRDAGVLHIAIPSPSKPVVVDVPQIGAALPKGK